MFAVGHMVHCYRGFAGSIRCVECHPTLPLVASCGLDRYVRIHDLEQQHLVNKVTTKDQGAPCFTSSNNYKTADSLKYPFCNLLLAVPK